MKKWYVDSDGTAIDWSAAVSVSGIASEDIFQLALPDGQRTPSLSLFAAAGQPVTSDQIAYAQAHTSSGDAIPTRTQSTDADDPSAHSGASEQSWIQVGKFGQGPVTVGAGLDRVSFIAALIGVDGIYGTSAEDESSLPAGWALVDDGSGGLNDVTVPAGVYLVRVVTTWDTSHTDGYRTLRVAAATSGGFDIRKGDDPILSTGQWYVDAISAVSADGGSLLGHSFDTKITADNSSADDVSVTFVEIDIYKIA